MGPLRQVRHAPPVGCRTGAVARLRSTTATSAGGIVIRQQSGVLEFVAGQRRRDHAHTWTLPKGTPIPGETTEETALREVGEESGLEVRILAPFDSINYTFIQRGTRVNKTVHYFLMEPTGGDLSRHDHEFEAVRWVAFADAGGLLTFETERALVAHAAEALATGTAGIEAMTLDLGGRRDVPGEAAS